jgi:hypothetical protein
MAKANKEKQCYIKLIAEDQTIPWPKPTLVLAMVLSDVLRCVLYNIVCPCWFWPWYCLTFIDVFYITLFLQTMLYKTHRRRSDNTIAKTNKDKQCYTKHIEERQTIPWPKPVCPCWFWPWYCLTFIDVFYITLFFLLGFGDGIV